MKIAQSTVDLVSTNKYYEENTVNIQSGVVTRESFLEKLRDQGDSYNPQNVTEKETANKTTEKEQTGAQVNKNTKNAPLGSSNYNFLKPTKSEYLSSYDSSLENQISQIRTSLLQHLLSFLQLLGGDNSRSGYRDMISQTSNMLTSQSFVKVTTIQVSHVEEEETSFEGKGTALTEDGRSIDFNVGFSLSRKLVQYAGLSMSNAVNMIDPLVINVGSDVTNISDQHFYFDLDSDGKDDKISNLGSGSGFLVYDRNGDGVINNGSELFGTKSGNGFKDLAHFDSDNNGWIDESDEIYGQLQVWLKGEDGKDTLLSLQEADVGAIYLGSAATEFTERNSVGAVAAMMRRSGLFLRESGGVGTVQQVDLARA